MLLRDVVREGKRGGGRGMDGEDVCDTAIVVVLAILFGSPCVVA